MSAYPPDALERVQAIQIDILKIVATICEEFDISWFAEGGTCLGAVRHGGFIPWDDDIDIAMTWNDFNLFCEIAPLVLEGTDYGLYTHKTTENYAPLFAKVYKKGTRFVGEHMLEAGFESGIFIDVFAYARLDSNRLIATKQIQELRLWQGVSYTREIVHPYLNPSLPFRPLFTAGLSVAHKVLQKTSRPESIETHFNKVIARGNGQGPWIDVFYPGGGLLQTEDLFPLDSCKFEDMEVPVPRNLPKYLSLLYGDYMSIPPEDQRFLKPPLILDFGDGKNVIQSEAGNPPSSQKAITKPLQNPFKAKKKPGEKTVAAAATIKTTHKSAEATLHLQKLHSVLLMMLKDFAALCENENLTWVGSYGTAIGALRHKGFIPWDDDIDICMPRQDLDRLVSIVLTNPNSQYEIVNSQRYPHYSLATTRLCLKGTEFRDSAFAETKFPSGIFIDIFPLDNLSDKPVLYYGQVFGSWFFNKLAIAKEFTNPTIVRTGLLGTTMTYASKGARGVLNLPILRNYNPNATSLKLLTLCSTQQCRYIGYPCDTFPMGCIYEISDIFPVRWVPFEDINIPVAAAAEKLLDDYYGNWNELPPESSRFLHYPEVLDFGPYF